MKPLTVYENGSFVEKQGARVESTMQNIADLFTEVSSKPQSMLKKSFILVKPRHKAISTVKKIEPASRETPSRCFYDFLQNNEQLLKNCGIKTAPLLPFPSYATNPIPHLFRYHPALGPTFAVIAQKLQRGQLSLGAEWIVDIAEIYARNISIDGSLRIYAVQQTGHLEGGVRYYSDRVGRCYLNNVVVKNRGLHQQSAANYWQSYEREESVVIHIEGDGEFFAENVVLQGARQYHVKAGERLSITASNGFVKESVENIAQASWSWKYRLEKDFSIKLSR